MNSSRKTTEDRLLDKIEDAMNLGGTHAQNRIRRSLGNAKKIHSILKEMGIHRPTKCGSLFSLTMCADKGKKVCLDYEVCLRSQSLPTHVKELISNLEGLQEDKGENHDIR